ncbi:INCE protein, partial [Rhynochetos jubatus]|nr:INCE protein [Rhynochetos jubatus]
RLSRGRNSGLTLRSSTRCSQLRNKENLELVRAEVARVSPPLRVTRSQAALLAEGSAGLPPLQQADGKVLVAETDVGEHVVTELQLQKSTPTPAGKLSTTSLLSAGHGSPKERRAAKSPPVPAASEPMDPPTPEADGAGESEAEPKQKTAKVDDTTVILSEEPGLEGTDDSAQAQEGPGKEPSQCVRDDPGTPTGLRLSRRSVRRSLMGKTSVTRRTSLAEKYSLASKRESVIRKSIARTMVKRKATPKSSVSSSCTDGELSDVGTPESGNRLFLRGTCAETPWLPLQGLQSPRMSLRSRTILRNEQPQETSSNGTCGRVRAAEPWAGGDWGLARCLERLVWSWTSRHSFQGMSSQESLGRRYSPRGSLLAFLSQVVRPFKTFLHTVQKNQLLMTPSSVGRNGVIKSFIRHNTPLQADPKEKERQKLETLRKKQEAEQLRKQKLEEEKRRRLEEARLKREVRLRKVLQARERAEQMEEERKRRIEQKIALFDEKSEKVREERLAEEKIRKRAAAKKAEEAEARRRQEEEARKQKALQQEEEERRQRELMQKRKEEEQERARKAVEQRQAEQERERQLERQREQERIQAER